jgi:hypothetical protein
MQQNKTNTLEEFQQNELLAVLKKRFQKHMHRHDTFKWADLEIKLISLPHKLHSLFLMEETGGEPDVVGYIEKTGEYVFFDCAAESPKGRRSICYDQEALDSRKEHKPKHSVMGMAAEMGIELLNVEEYKALQALGAFDLKTSSWLRTPDKIRKLGGAIFGDRRFDTVFIYHNGAESYYGSRGFRGRLHV